MYNWTKNVYMYIVPCQSGIAPFPVVSSSSVVEQNVPFTKNGYRYLSQYDFRNLGTDFIMVSVSTDLSRIQETCIDRWIYIELCMTSIDILNCDYFQQNRMNVKCKQGVMLLRISFILDVLILRIIQENLKK